MRHGLIGLLGVMVLGTMTAAGCGGGGSEPEGSGGTGAGGTGGGNSVTSLNSATPLAGLAPADATKLCDDTYAYFRTAIATELACKWKGLSFATSSSAPSQEQLRANCTEKETGCLGDPATALAATSPCSPFPGGCTATVAEYSTCVKDIVTAFNQDVATIEACAVLTSAGTDAVWAAKAAEFPSCAFSNCPGLFPPSPFVNW